tara:strand:+ start:1596 stop:2087 length:492 start_codon:yes stop_codon:yes gene_type:complete
MNIFTSIVLLSILIISVESYSGDVAEVGANEKQMLEIVNEVNENLPALKEAISDYQDNPYMRKAFMEMMLQQAEDFANMPPSEISELAVGAEQEIGDFNDRGETPVISSMLCAPDVLEYAPPFILTICSEYNKSGKTTEYKSSGGVLWCVVEGEYSIPEHCKN